MVKIFVDGDDKSMGTKLFVTPDLWENGKAKVISSMLTISIVPIRFLLLYFPANIPAVSYTHLEIKSDDTLWVVMSRRERLSYHANMSRIPNYLNKYFQSNSFVLVYPIQAGETNNRYLV